MTDHDLHEPDADSSSGCGSITRLLMEVKDHRDNVAQQELAHRYWKRLAGLARVKLRSCAKRMFDEEDIVVQTLHSFFRAAEEGKCPNLLDREDLWSYLVCVAERKSIDLLRAESREKRGGGKALDEQLAFGGDGSGRDALDTVVGPRDPAPDVTEQLLVLADEFTSCCFDFLNLLDEDGRTIAVLKGRGYTNKEIAAALHTQERTIERKLQKIRATLSSLAE